MASSALVRPRSRICTSRTCALARHVVLAACKLWLFRFFFLIDYNFHQPAPCRAARIVLCVDGDGIREPVREIRGAARSPSTHHCHRGKRSQIKLDTVYAGRCVTLREVGVPGTLKPSARRCCLTGPPTTRRAWVLAWALSPTHRSVSPAAPFAIWTVVSSSGYRPATAHPIGRCPPSQGGPGVPATCSRHRRTSP